MLVPRTVESAEQLDELAEVFLDACRDGQQPSIEEYARQHPDLAERIRELFPALAVLERAGSGDPEQLGEFQIVRRIGRGGMGVVYEALQGTLGRRVALKVLAVGPHTRPTVLERFQREARTAARLHHGNIVPVFGVGADRGTHFFAMQYIDGASLDQVIAEVRRIRAGQATTVADDSASWLTGARGDYYRRAASAAAQAADALAYAHRQGVLHRDVKPSNVLLDAQGTLWVADFGLAKEAGAVDLTTTGEVVGTLRYLAPERLTGAADERSDVYSLGATLYELLTLRPAFDAADRANLIKQVTDGDPVPPRRLDPAIAPDLETVVLKAMAREPAERYATAAEFAEDLRNVVADRPVKARRLSAVARATRWSRRNPGTAALIGVSVGLVLVVAVGATISAAVLANKNAALAAANVRERQRFDLALDAIGMFHGQLSQDLLLKEKRFERSRTQLLASATKFYTDLESQLSGRNDPASRQALARAHDQLADLVRSIRPAAEARSIYQKSVAMWENLATLPTADAMVHLHLARQLVNLGRIQMSLKDQATANTFAQARHALEQAERQFGVSNDSRIVRFFVHDATGYCRFHIQSRIPEARVEFDHAAQILDELSAARLGDMEIQNWQGSLQMDIGITVAAPIQQARHLGQAVVHYKTCLAANDSNPRARYDVAHARAALACILDVQIPTSEGLAHAQAAIDTTTALAGEYTEIWDFARVLAMAHQYAAELYLLDGRLGDARVAAEAARTGRQDLCSHGRVGMPALAETLTTVADVDRAEKRFDAALAGYRNARVIYEDVLAKTPTDWNYCNMAQTVRRLGLAELALGHPAEAAAATIRARDLIEPRVRKLCIGPSYWFDLACCHATLAGLAGVAGSCVPLADGDREAALATQTLREGLEFFRPPIAKLNRERGLDPVRQRPDFLQFFRDMEALAADRERKTPG